MGRKKLTMRRIENPTSRQLTYTKRKEGIIKKAGELAVLCDTDVALIMFAPSGRLASFASNGRIEDILLRFVDRPDELRGGPINHEEFLSQKLKQLKYEGEMLEKIAVIEELEEKLDKLTRKQRESQEKMRYYEPNVEKINSALEAGVYQQFLTTAIQRIQTSKAKLLGNQLGHERTENVEVQAATMQMDDAVSLTGHSAEGNHARMRSNMDENQSGSSSAAGPHLSLGFIESQKMWNKTWNI
ncbi:agamous-like MADS-box protein AGL104 [Salvia splendens]|uniref:agamous-like MADS-box protein AGL104 n=1 Tax=Salvia splendens TaxID=180675 RepID=UPI001C27C980|nr:agamous-like MADS-box protein AGL104 [Salvia splendens]